MVAKFMAPLALTVFLLPGPAHAKTIVIDAGHGGRDRGATLGTVYESEITLKIANLVAKNLESTGHKVVYTRTKDEWMSLEKRALIANRARADIFVSIHLNSSDDPRAKGKEFYFQNQVPVDEEALFLANRENQDETSDSAHSHLGNHEHSSTTSPTNNDRTAVSGLRAAETERIPELKIEDPRVRKDIKSIIEDLDRSARVRASSDLAVELFTEWKAKDPTVRNPSRAVRQAPFFLVSHVAMPSVLVEVGYLSHKREGEKLQQANYQKLLAEAIANGIRKNLAKTSPQTP